MSEGTPTREGRARGPFEWLRLFGVALQFLTRIPVRVRFEADDLHRSTGAFPLVAALVAAAGIAVRWSLGPLVGATLATVLAVAATVLLTGAFHEDGVADAVDGLWGGGTPEERLRIMRDSRIGSYGTLALILLVLTKVAALAPMSVDAFAATLVPAMTLGRASSLVLMRTVPPAPDSLASLAGSPSPAGWAVAIATCGLSLAGFGARTWLLAVSVVAVAGLVTAGAAIVSRRKIGGINGDLLGAANQAVEVATLLCGVVGFAR